MAKKRPAQSKAFTSLRIIGKKAQKLIESAKLMGTSQNSNGTKTKLPRRNQLEEVVMHISTASVAKATFAILAIAVGAWLIYHLRSKIIVLLLAMFVAAVIDPGVQALERWGVPRPIGILVHFAIALFLLIFLVLSFIPIIASQVQEIAVLLSVKANTFLADPTIAIPFLSEQTNEQLSNLTETILRGLSINQFADAMQRFGQNLSSTAQQSVLYVAQLAGSVARFFVSLIVVLVLAFFIQMEKEKLTKWSVSFFPVKYRMYVHAKAEAVHRKISQWVRGELMLMFSIFLLTLTALVILRMPYALTLAVLAGFCEFIPAIGPFIAAVPAILIGATQGGFIWVLILMGVYYVIQWCENNLLVPLIMKRAVGLSPIAILFAMLVGISFPETIHPVLGVMLAIPMTTIITLFLEDWRDRDSA